MLDTDSKGVAPYIYLQTPCDCWPFCHFDPLPLGIVVFLSSFFSFIYYLQMTIIVCYYSRSCYCRDCVFLAAVLSCCQCLKSTLPHERKTLCVVTVGVVGALIRLLGLC